MNLGELLDYRLVQDKPIDSITEYRFPANTFHGSNLAAYDVSVLRSWVHQPYYTLRIKYRYSHTTIGVQSEHDDYPSTEMIVVRLRQYLEAGRYELLDDGSIRERTTITDELMVDYARRLFRA
jgi:hypothetical protein